MNEYNKETRIRYNQEWEWDRKEEDYDTCLFPLAFSYLYEFDVHVFYIAPFNSLTHYTMLWMCKHVFVFFFSFLISKFGNEYKKKKK